MDPRWIDEAVVSPCTCYLSGEIKWRLTGRVCVSLKPPPPGFTPDKILLSTNRGRDFVMSVCRLADTGPPTDNFEMVCECAPGWMTFRKLVDVPPKGRLPFGVSPAHRVSFLTCSILCLSYSCELSRLVPSEIRAPLYCTATPTPNMSTLSLH